MIIPSREGVREAVDRAVAQAKVTDIHTHLYPRQFGDLMLWGVDELLTYHYLIAEAIRQTDVTYERFWSFSKSERADFIWKTLFLDRSPISESCRGVITVLASLGFDLSTRDLNAFRESIVGQDVDRHTDRVFELAGVESVVMTNDPFDSMERDFWMGGGRPDPRFKAALRVDVLLNLWETAWPILRDMGYDVSDDFRGDTPSEVRRFLAEWANRMDALYMAVSLEPAFTYPEDSIRGRLIDECILPISREENVPFALMIGVKRRVNPLLQMAGDGAAKSCVESVERLCDLNPDNKFLITMLTRENQHELCVVGRKFRNLLVFGCWWFLNVPSMIEEITRMRIELLGLSMLPQHSDARILEQLIYKWRHSREVISRVIADKYEDIHAAGWRVTEEEIRRDVDDLFGGNFWKFIGKSP